MRVKAILLVEDDQALRSVIARNLEALGYLVTQAATFHEAQEQVAMKPGLLILDINLPDATGWDVARWLESLTEPVPIILISGDTPDRQNLARFQPVAFLPKPFAIDDLLGLVQEQLGVPLGRFGA